MVDYEIYNERRQQLIDTFEGAEVDFLEYLKHDITYLVDNLDWEDNEALAEYMGWTNDGSSEV